jgi:pyruvate dehydrogenase E1 component alpha subunit
MTSVPFEDDVVRVLREDGSLEPGADEGAASAEVVAIYRAMVRARALDDRLVALQRAGRIAFHVGSQGEEAAILGSAAALRERDWIFPCYREFGAALWRGMPLESYVSHMFGSAADPVKGRQMPDHYSARIARFTSISSPLGTQITQAVGFAWAAKTKREDLVALAYFGEGATSSGEFHNAINFAGVFRAPVVLFCRNNGWAAPMAERQTASATFAAKGVGYDVPGVRCDGNDLFAVLKVTREAIARASRGDGATLIEALTARMPLARDVRDFAAAVASWKKKDPLARVRRYLEGKELWSEASEHEHEAQVLAEIDAAIASAEVMGPPPLATMFDDVYAEPTPQLAEQRADLLAGPRARGFAKVSPSAE